MYNFNKNDKYTQTIILLQLNNGELIRKGFTEDLKEDLHTYDILNHIYGLGKWKILKIWWL